MSGNKDNGIGGQQLFGHCTPKDGEKNCCNDHTVLPGAGPPDPTRYCDKAHGSTFQEGTGKCAKYWTKVGNSCTAADYIPLFGVPTLSRLSTFQMEYMIGEQVETSIPILGDVDEINTCPELFELKPAKGEICVLCDGYYNFTSSIATFDLDNLDWRMTIGGMLNGTTQFGRLWTSGNGQFGMGNAPIFYLPNFHLKAGDCVSGMAWTDRPGGLTVELAYVSLERIY